MSLSSRAIARLRKLYNVVYRRNSIQNSDILNSLYSCSAASSENCCNFETLEPRLLLSGTNFVVNSLADTVADDGLVTLREAIEAANTNTAVTADVPAGSGDQTDIITFDLAALQAEAGSGNDLVIALTNGSISIIDNLKIAGPGQDVLTIDAISAAGFFNVTSHNADISGVTLENGMFYGLSAQGEVDISVSDTAFINTGRNAIYNDEGHTILDGVTITGSSGYNGAAVFSNTVNISNSKFTQNTTSYDGTVYVADNWETSSIVSSVFYGNTAGDGGAIYSNGPLYIANTIICGNTADSGSAIYINGDHEVTINNSTICNNPGDTVEGLNSSYDDDMLTINNTIAIMNKDVDRSDYSDNNFIGSRKYFNTHDYYEYIYANDIFVRNPSPGPDETWGTADDDYGDLRLKPYCSLIGYGENTYAQDADGQQLTTDVFGNPRIIGANVDVGAVESDGPAAQTYLVESFENVIAEDGILTYIEALTAANNNTETGDAPAGSYVYQDIITFAPELTELRFTEDMPLNIIDDLAFEGTGRQNLSFTAETEDISLNIYNQATLNITGLNIAVPISGGKMIITDSDCTAELSPDTLYMDNVGATAQITIDGTAEIRNSSICKSSEYGIWANGDLYLYNVTIAENESGAIRLAFRRYNELHIINSTICDNGSGISTFGTYPAGVIANSIFARNQSDEDLYVSDMLVTNNFIGSADSELEINGNMIGSTDAPLDPRLSELTLLDSSRWGYYVYPSSPVINTGNNDYAVDAEGNPLSTDIYGNARISGRHVDIGAIETDGNSHGYEPQAYEVNSLADTIAEDGLLTLREALEAANTNTAVGDAPAGSFEGKDIITFANGLSGTILLNGQELTISDSVSIIGPGADILSIDAGQSSRVINISDLASVEISGMTITGGKLASQEEYNAGAGILNSGVLELSSVNITNNQITGNSINGGGAGICNTRLLYINDSTINDNSAYIESDSRFPEYPGRGQGGAIATQTGKLVISNSIISNNTANFGGGISYTSGQMSLFEVIIEENQANGYCGGGIHVSTSNGSGYNQEIDSISLENVNISRNITTGYETTYYSPTGFYTAYAAGEGGGIYVYLYRTGDSDESSYALDINLQNTTISGNKAEKGGGIYSEVYDYAQDAPQSFITMSNSVLVGNIAKQDGGGIHLDSGNLDIINTTIVGNYSDEGSDGISSGDYDNNTRKIVNSIIGNRNSSCTIWISFHDRYTGNINPIFVRNPSAGDDGLWGTDDDDFGDLHLRGIDSIINDGKYTAINNGDNSLSVDANGNLLTTDIEGNPRMVYGFVDCGAYEYQGLEADIDYSGSVDISDFLILKSNYGQTTSGGKTYGDLDGDGDVDIRDFLILKSQYNQAVYMPADTAPAMAVSDQLIAANAASPTAAIPPENDAAKTYEAQDTTPPALEPDSLLWWKAPLNKTIYQPQLELEILPII